MLASLFIFNFGLIGLLSIISSGILEEKNYKHAIFLSEA